MFLIVITAVVIVGVAALILVLSMPSDKANAQIELTMKLLSEQAQAMALRKSQLVYSDRFGVAKTERWEREKLYIANSVVKPKLRAAGLGELPTQILLPLIEHSIGLIDAGGASSEFSKVSTGVEYEKHCAEILRKAGWTARVTVATGDQGTDIVAERGGRRVVIQCKFYTKPVGNKAVQEAAAARMHEKADQAVVVSNAAYTPAARELAGTTAVRLLHHDDLINL